MIRHENENGSVNVSTGVYTGIVGTAASNCFGVKGMAARTTPSRARSSSPCWRAFSR